jgi:hypothetical protein
MVDAELVPLTAAVPDRRHVYIYTTSNNNNNVNKGHKSSSSRLAMHRQRSTFVDAAVGGSDADNDDDEFDRHKRYNDDTIEDDDDDGGDDDNVYDERVVHERTSQSGYMSDDECSSETESDVALVITNTKGLPLHEILDAQVPFTINMRFVGISLLAMLLISAAIAWYLAGFHALEQYNRLRTVSDLEAPFLLACGACGLFSLLVVAHDQGSRDIAWNKVKLA